MAECSSAVGLLELRSAPGCPPPLTIAALRGLGDMIPDPSSAACSCPLLRATPLACSAAMPCAPLLLMRESDMELEQLERRTIWRVPAGMSMEGGVISSEASERPLDCSLDSIWRKLTTRVSRLRWSLRAGVRER